MNAHITTESASKKSSKCNGALVAGILFGSVLSFLVYIMSSQFVQTTVPDGIIVAAQKHCAPHGGLFILEVSATPSRLNDTGITCLDNSTILYKDIKK
jgi:hypothetical protein